MNRPSFDSAGSYVNPSVNVSWRNAYVGAGAAGGLVDRQYLKTATAATASTATAAAPTATVFRRGSWTDTEALGGGAAIAGCETIVRGRLACESSLRSCSATRTSAIC